MSDYDNIYQTISSLTHRIMMDVQFKFLRPRIMDIFPQATIQRVEGGGNKASCDIMSSLCQEVSRLSRKSFFRFVQAIEMDHPDVAEDIRVKYKAVTRGITIPHPESKKAPTSLPCGHQALVTQESGSSKFSPDGPTSAEPSSSSGAVGFSPSSHSHPPQRPQEHVVIEQRASACAYDQQGNRPAIQETQPVVTRRTQRGQLSKYKRKYEENQRKVYRMDDDPRGVCLIISNETFENLSNRPGSECDVRALEELFRNYLGFDVLLERNKTAKQMQDWLKGHASEYDFSGVSALAVAILTHGLEGDKFLGTDGKPVTRVQLASIFNSENCEALKGKPKLFIFQACRGNQTQEVGPIGAFELEQADAVGEVTAHNADMCFVFATSAGYQAYRHREDGSPFVTKFCQQVRADAHSKEFAKIIREITEHFSQEEVGNAMMLTDYHTQLTKSWYLNPPNPPPS